MRSATRRAHDVNFGDRTVVRGAEKQPLAEISVEDAQAFTVYVAARVEPENARVVPLVALEWGHGGASIAARELRIYRRLRVPVVGSMVRLTGRIVDENGGPPPANVSCHLSAFIAPGSDGETLRNTDWLAQHGAEGSISKGPEQVVTVAGYPASAGARWVMLFDELARPADGAFPRMAAPASAAFRMDRFDTQGFRNGVYWAASATPMTLTFDASADIRVDIELLT